MMISAVQHVSNVFNPQKPVEADFKAAVKSAETQRIARIAKIALFALASIATTATLVLSEAAVIAWPVTVPLIALTLILGAIFFRLNSIDRQYQEWIDDDLRASLVEKELERLFHSHEIISDNDFAKSLKNVNLVLGNTVFDEEKIEYFTELNTLSRTYHDPMSIAETAKDQMVPIQFSCTSEWVEESRFGLPPYEYSFAVTWDPTPGNIRVTYHCAEQKGENPALQQSPAMQENPV